MTVTALKLNAFQLRNAEVPTIRYRITNLDDVVASYMNEKKAGGEAFDLTDAGKQALALDNIDLELASEFSDLHFTDLNPESALATVLLALPMKKADGTAITSSDLGITASGVDPEAHEWSCSKNVILSIDVASYGGAVLLQDGTEYQAFLETWMSNSNAEKIQLAGAPPAVGGFSAVGNPDEIVISFNAPVDGEASAGFGEVRYISVSLTDLATGTAVRKLYNGASQTQYEAPPALVNGKMILYGKHSGGDFDIKSGHTYEASVFVRNDFAAGPSANELVSASNRPKKPTDLVVNSAAANLASGEVKITFKLPYTTGGLVPQPTAAHILIETRPAAGQTATEKLNKELVLTPENHSDDTINGELLVEYITVGANLEENVPYKCTVVSVRSLASGEVDNADSNAGDNKATSLPLTLDFNYVNLSQGNFALSTSLDQATSNLTINCAYPVEAEFLPAELSYTKFYVRITNNDQAILQTIATNDNTWSLVTPDMTSTDAAAMAWTSETGRALTTLDGPTLYTMIPAALSRDNNGDVIGYDGVKSVVASLPTSALYTSLTVNASLFATYTVGGNANQVRPISTAAQSQTVVVTAAPPAVTDAKYYTHDSATKQGYSIEAADGSFEGRIKVEFTEVVASKIDSADIYYDVYAIQEVDGALPTMPTSVNDLEESTRIGRIANSDNESNSSAVSVMLPNIAGKDTYLEVGYAYAMVLVSRFNGGVDAGVLSSGLVINKSNNANPLTGTGYVPFGQAQAVDNLAAVARINSSAKAEATVNFSFPNGVTGSGPYPGLDSNTVRITAQNFTASADLKFIESGNVVDHVDVTWSNGQAAERSVTVAFGFDFEGTPTLSTSAQLPIGTEIKFSVATLMDGGFNGKIANFTTTIAAAPVIDESAGFTINGTNTQVTFAINNKGAKLRELVVVPVLAADAADEKEAVWARLNSTNSVIAGTSASDADQNYTVSFKYDDNSTWSGAVDKLFVVAENREGLDVDLLDKAVPAG